MSGRSVVTLTTAPAGTGKSYRRCGHFLLTEVLPHTKLIHLSNFPIKFDAWGDAGEKRGFVEVARLRGISEDAVRDRVQLLPEDVVESWRDGASGPWDYFESRDISGHHLAIDEIHNFCGKNHKPNIRLRWQKWLGEIRHRGARIEFITQHPQKVATEITNEAEVRLSLVGQESERDPFFRIPLRDWYNIKAKFTGVYRPAVVEIEKQQRDGKWVDMHKRVFRFEDDVFEVYDSFSAPVQGGGRGELEKEPWERLSWPKLMLWFGSRNGVSLSLRFGVGAFFVWFGFLGGGRWAMVWGMDAMKSHITGQTKPKKQNPAVAAPPAPLFGPPSTQTMTGDLVQWADSQPPGAGSVDLTQQLVDENELKNLMSGWRVSAISDTAVHFNNGEWWAVGEKIDDGPFKGREVVAVDFLRRRVDLGAGLLVRVGAVDAGVRQWAVSQLRSFASDVRRPLQSGGGGKSGVAGK